MSQKTESHRVVVVSPVPALTLPSHAGGLLLTNIVRAHQSAGAKVVVVTPSTDTTLKDLNRTTLAAPTLLLGKPRDYRGLRRLALTAVYRALPILPSREPAEVSWPFAVDLLFDQRARALLRSADVVDLQWEEFGRLAPLMRRLAPEAALTCMFHDVNDQRLSRAVEAAGSAADRRQAGRRRARNRRLLERTVHALDRGFILSEKDSWLLAAIAPSLPLTVVPPPIADGSVAPADVSLRPPVVGFVASLSRGENRDAAMRLATRIWPIVHAARPDATLRIVGGGLDDGTRAALHDLPGVEITGFVDDLDDAYSVMRATISPIDQGAGVKFKVIESIIRGIPTFSTTVGAEGIDRSLISLVSDDDRELADGVIKALSDEEVAFTARTVARRAGESYGVKAFCEGYMAGIRESLSARGSTH